MKLTQVRLFALSLPEATEEPHFQSASFRIRGKIFATVPADGEHLHVFVSDEEREIALATEPAFVEKLYWGARVAGLRVVLAKAKPKMVERLLKMAWSHKAPKTLLGTPTKPINTSSPVGYSGTPLAKKFGIKEDSHVLLVSAPDTFTSLLEPLPESVQFDKTLTDRTDIVIVFSSRKDELKKHLAHFRNRLRSNAMVWVSWPKKASKMPTDITEDTIREVALPLGFVDIKVCAVSEVWSGLKLVVRKELR